MELKLRSGDSDYNWHRENIVFNTICPTPTNIVNCIVPVADPGGGPRGPWPPPGPVKIGHKKDGRRRWPHRFHVSRPPPYPAAGSATEY